MKVGFAEPFPGAQPHSDVRHWNEASKRTCHFLHIRVVTVVANGNWFLIEVHTLGSSS